MILDLLHFAKERRAKLVLLGSSMRVVKDVLSSRVPLVRPVKLDLMRPFDVLKIFKTAERPCSSGIRGFCSSTMEMSWTV